MERKLTRFHLFNCDNTYSLNSVEALLLKMEDKLKLKIAPVEKHYFRLQQMTEICETAIPKLPMDVAIFVVHAHESRLSINEDNAGIGYAKFYKALLQATGKFNWVIKIFEFHFRVNGLRRRSTEIRELKVKIACFAIDQSTNCKE